MATKGREFVIRLKPSQFLIGLLVLISLGALGYAALLPSFRIELTVQNATTEPVAVSVIGIDAKTSSAAWLAPGETRKLTLFSGDGNDPVKWRFMGIVMDTRGEVIQRRAMTWKDFRETPWVIRVSAATQASVP